MIHGIHDVYRFIRTTCTVYDIPYILEHFIDRLIGPRAAASISETVFSEILEKLQEPNTLKTIWLAAAKCFWDIRERFLGKSGLYPMTPGDGNVYHDIGMIRCCALLSMALHGTAKDICPLSWHIFYLEAWKAAAPAIDHAQVQHLSSPVLWSMLYCMTQKRRDERAIKLVMAVGKRQLHISDQLFNTYLTEMLRYKTVLNVIYQNAL